MSHIEKQAGKAVKRPGANRAPTPVVAPGDWTYFSNHGHVLFCLAREPEMLLREVAARVGVTERAVQRIVADLDTGAVTAERYDNITYDSALGVFPFAGQMQRQWRAAPGLPNQPKPDQISALRSSAGSVLRSRAPLANKTP